MAVHLNLMLLKEEAVPLQSKADANAGDISREKMREKTAR